MHGLPCVTTPTGAEGLQTPEGTRYGRDVMGSLTRVGFEAQAFASSLPGIGSMGPVVIIVWRKATLRPTQ
ncbi:MAG: hypothetical protein H6Q00_3357 [Holophagaceae bacterium]|nr:hypothetical protein [Holophagaceae bacterium]